MKGAITGPSLRLGAWPRFVMAAAAIAAFILAGGALSAGRPVVGLALSVVGWMVILAEGSTRKAIKADHAAFVALVIADAAEHSALTAKLHRAVECARRFGGVDGGHHKDWVIDQMVRELLGGDYKEWVADAKAGEDGPDTYDWSEGVPP